MMDDNKELFGKRLKIEKAKERRNLSWETLTYSDRRIDLLLISISGAGIYVCLEAIRFLSDKNRETHWLIWIASICFLLAILFNFIGQFIGRKANYYDFLMCDAEINSCENPDNIEFEKDFQHFDNLSDKFNKWVDPINYGCTTFMISGITSILGYFLMIF